MTALRVALVGAGATPSASAIWRACREAGVDVTAIAARRRNVESGDPGIPVRRLPRIHLRGNGNLWKLLIGLGRTLGELRPHLVHIHCEPWGILALQGVRSARRVGALVVIHGADNRFDHGGRLERRIRTAVIRRVLPRIDGYASWNSAGIRLARAHGLRAEAPDAVAPIVVPDPSRFHPPDPAGRAAARARFGLPREGVVVGLLGRLVPEKGVSDGLAALRRLGAAAPFLAVWGRGPMEPTIRSALADGIRGRFGGSLEPREVPEALRACDLVMVPSRTAAEWEEQFGRVGVEAQASGCAVVAYRSGALGEVLEQGAVLVPEGDTEALAEAVGELTEDPAARSALVEKGIAWAAHRWHPRAVAADIVDLWERMLSR